MRIVTVLMVLAGTLVLAACSAFDPPMLTMCEGVLKERLRSPSGYQRISYRSLDRSLTPDEYLAALKEHRPETPISDIDRSEAASGAPTLFQMLIEYDAPNAYGTLVRGNQICDYLGTKAEFAAASDFFIRIDGKTRIEWLVSQAR